MNETRRDVIENWLIVIGLFLGFMAFGGVLLYEVAKDHARQRIEAGDAGGRR